MKITSPKCLIIDDDPIVSRILSLLVSREGLECVLAADQFSALTLAEAHQDTLQICFLDFSLPLTDSGALFETLSKMLSAPVIFISGYSKSELANQMPGLEFQFLGKPFMRAQILEILRGPGLSGNTELASV